MRLNIFKYKDHAWIGTRDKNVVFSNTGPDPLQGRKAAKPAFNVGPSSVRLRADDGPLIVVFGSSLPSSTKKKHVIVDGTPSDKTFWILACRHYYRK